ncbi:MAG: hypothetical protein ABJA82_08155 [Myxococcales bacterium]
MRISGYGHALSVTSGRCLTVSMVCAAAVMMMGLSGPARAQGAGAESRGDTAATESSASSAPTPPTLELAPPGVGVAEMDNSPFPLLLEEQIRQNEALAVSHHPAVNWSGYIDFGLFVPQGNGSGYVQDVGHERLNRAPYTSYNWVFLGDILAPTVNTRGEAADLGNAPGVSRFDSINSRGAPGFVLNEVNLRLTARPAPTAILSASVNLVPRTGNDFALGDVLDVDLAQLEWLPTESQRTSIFVGKVDSVLGIEYRDRKSNHRFGVTPSLIARYTTGTALGLKVRSKFGQDDWLVIAAALTNGSNTTEQFHFYDELDSNAAKTGSGRLSVRLPLPIQAQVELGFSGSYGAQDRTTSNQHAMWFFGPDLLAEVGPVVIKAQWLKGRAPGDPTQQAYQLDLHGGGYVEVDAMLTSSWGVLGRAEYRDAFVALDLDRAYLTKSWRATGGIRCVMSRWAAVKAEYLRNGEYGDVPQVRNDVFTSSLVLSY